MKRLILVTLVTAATLVIGVGVASARDTFPSTIKTSDVVDGGGGIFLITGTVSSPKPKCISGRTVKAIAKFGGKSQVVDVDGTSANGAWATVGSFGGADLVTIKVTKSKIGRPGHRHVCGSDSTLVV